jgi:hypothetical protein
MTGAVDPVKDAGGAGAGAGEGAAGAALRLQGQSEGGEEADAAVRAGLAGMGRTLAGVALEAESRAPRSICRYNKNMEK